MESRTCQTMGYREDFSEEVMPELIPVKHSGHIEGVGGMGAEKISLQNRIRKEWGIVLEHLNC